MMSTIPDKLWVGLGGKKLKLGGRGPGTAPRDFFLFLRNCFGVSLSNLNHQGCEKRRGLALLAIAKVWEVPKEVC